MSNQLGLNAQERKIIELSALGGMLEFYDFIIYGMFSVDFAHQFFQVVIRFYLLLKASVVFFLRY